MGTYLPFSFRVGADLPFEDHDPRARVQPLANLSRAMVTPKPRERVLYWQPTGPNPLNHRDDLSRSQPVHVMSTLHQPVACHGHSLLQRAGDAYMGLVPQTPRS